MTAVDAEHARLTEAGLAPVDERDTTCCYARQDKFWVQGAPNGERWEVYTSSWRTARPSGARMARRPRSAVPPGRRPTGRGPVPAAPDQAATMPGKAVTRMPVTDMPVTDMPVPEIPVTETAVTETVLWRRLLAELLGSAFLAVVVVGSGIAAQRLSPGQTGLELLENAAATAAGLFAIILMFGPVSGGHFNPLVSFADAAFGGLRWRDAAAYLPGRGGLWHRWRRDREPTFAAGRERVGRASTTPAVPRWPPPCSITRPRDGSRWPPPVPARGRAEPRRGGGDGGNRARPLP